MTYTIREIVPAGPLVLADAVRLQEIVNPVRQHLAPSGPVVTELLFRADRFRPLCRTNIEVFERMLAPVPQEPAELVEA